MQILVAAVITIECAFDMSEPYGIDETQWQRDVPFSIPHFLRRCIYKLQNLPNICIHAD